jgi:UDPglucose 6-dehydrogenase
VKILIIGTGYVGTTTGLVFCELGHQVTGLDLDQNKINSLKAGKLHFYEPGLEDLLRKHVNENNIVFTDKAAQAIKENDVIFICVGTPQDADGRADLKYVEAVATSIGTYMDSYKVIVDKSTVPVGTAENVTKWIQAAQTVPIEFDVVSNPEFLREGSALLDALKPDRIVIGTTSPKARKIMKKLYKGFRCSVVETDPKAAELIKYAANAFLALKISYINELARLCHTLQINVDEISKGIGFDQRIGPQFLKAGIGYGGSCFPKDVSALLKTAQDYQHNLTILDAAVQVNQTQTGFFINQIKEHFGGSLFGKKLAVLGLAFKANTDDTRESPAFRLIDELLNEQAEINCYDPVAVMANDQASQQQSLEEALQDADAAIICTDWQEFYAADWDNMKQLMRTPVIFDGKNFLDGDQLTQAGYNYYKI